MLLVIASLSVATFSIVTAFNPQLPILPITQIVDSLTKSPKQIFDLTNNKLVLLYPDTFF